MRDIYIIATMAAIIVLCVILGFLLCREEAGLSITNCKIVGDFNDARIKILGEPSDAIEIGGMYVSTRLVIGDSNGTLTAGSIALVDDGHPVDAISIGDPNA